MSPHDKNSEETLQRLEELKAFVQDEFFLSPNWPVKLKIREKDFEPEVIQSALAPYLSESRKSKFKDVALKRSRDCVLVCENIYNLGNINAVMRSMEAFGFLEIHIVYKPKGGLKNSSRVSQGAHKWLDIRVWDNIESCVSHLKEREYKVFTTHLDEKATSIYEMDKISSVALILGNEKEGVSCEALALADGSVILPMLGFAQSFNISVAASLALQWARSFRAKEAGLLSVNEALATEAVYYLRGVENGEAIFLESLERTS